MVFRVCCGFLFAGCWHRLMTFVGVRFVEFWFGFLYWLLGWGLACGC